VRRATDHQWFAQNSSPQRSLHHDRRRAGNAVPHHAHAPDADGGASEQTASNASFFVTGDREER
jgi:hypothetical protein